MSRKACHNCGREIIRSVGRYCSEKCQKEAREDGRDLVHNGINFILNSLLPKQPPTHSLPNQNAAEVGDSSDVNEAITELLKRANDLSEQLEVYESQNATMQKLLDNCERRTETVSYTHLTLPTILLV